MLSGFPSGETVALGDGRANAFSLEPAEFRERVEAIRMAEQALGTVSYSPTEAEAGSLFFRRSRFLVRNVGAGETLTEETVRSIRPGHSLAPKHLPVVLGRRARARY